MYKVSVNNKPEQEVTIEHGELYIKNQPSGFDLVKNSDGTFHVLYKGKSYTIRTLESNGHHLKFEMNDQPVETYIKNELDDLLSQLGMDKKSGQQMNELKAPMPGMVLKVLVKEGDNVQAGESLLVLEAMKMENNIKAIGDGVVSKVNVEAGDKVEKNQILIQF